MKEQAHGLYNNEVVALAIEKDHDFVRYRLPLEMWGISTLGVKIHSFNLWRYRKCVFLHANCNHVSLILGQLTHKGLHDHMLETCSMIAKRSSRLSVCN